MRAEASMRRFSTYIGLGLPVEPLVCTNTVGLSLCHSAKNSSNDIVSFLDIGT